ncbi:hypothetical protein ALC62_12123, partial [Cyphomyrmex costatus]
EEKEEYRGIWGLSWEKKRGGDRRWDKGQTPPRCCLILAIALFERRSNARTEYAAKYLGSWDRDRDDRRGLSVGIATAISRPDRTITTIGRSKFVDADRAFDNPRASVYAAPV